MVYETAWQDYELIDASEGKRLERWGEYILIRPDPQVIWRSPSPHPMWCQPDAVYERSDKGGGRWITTGRTLPERWQISYGPLGLRFNISAMGFKHTGLFPEQAYNWQILYGLIKRRISSGNGARVLNLFAYTGGASVACAAAGAEVCHVDASKGMIAYAKLNAESSGLAQKPIRYIADDCVKFTSREIRRGKRYDIIIMDPPTYGRGTSGEMWRLEDNLYDLLCECSKLLSDDPIAVLVNQYSAGIAPSCAGYMLGLSMPGNKKTTSDEIGIRASHTGLAVPCGSFSLCEFQ